MGAELNTAHGDPMPDYLQPITLNDIMDRMEPEARESGHHVGSVGEAAQVSIAISLKRLADALAGKTDGTSISWLELIADRMPSL